MDSHTFDPQSQHQHLRNLQAESLSLLYVATSLIGLGLVFLTLSERALWRFGLIGIGLLFLPPLFRWLIKERYLPLALVLLLLWSGAIIAAAVFQGPVSLVYLLALPVIMAMYLLNTPTAAALAAVQAAALLALARTQPLAPAADWPALLILMGGALLITRLALQPIYSSLSWSLQNYQSARAELQEARAAQADLKQAIKDLADAGTQMARLNQLLAIARQSAEDAERAKAEFVANVSHELRTPLNMIIGFSEMILNSSGLYGRIPKALMADLAVINRNSQHLSELINDVLDLSQIEAGKMPISRDQVYLQEIIEAAAVAIRPLFETKKLYLTINVPAGLQVTCDRTRIREVLLNLLSNAGRFVEKGGVELKAQVEEDHVVVSVADTGPGISDEAQARLFQPFQQVDGSIRRRYGGTGLGLSISRHFVEMHGGKMWLESELGRGTTIFFTLPVLSQAGAGSGFDRWNVAEWEYRQRTRRWAAPRLEVKPRVALVDSGPVFERLLHRYLDGVEVVRFESLDAISVQLKESGAQALLVNAFEIDQTITRLWEEGLLPAGFPAIVCGIHGSEEAARDLGANAYLVKPVAQDTLRDALDRLGIAGGTVLIVDDELDAIQLFWRMLASFNRGYRVLTASNGQEAIAVLDGETPDAILLDLTMPTMDGFQFLEWLRQQPRWQETPVIIMSARDPDGHPVAAGAVGITRGGGLTIHQITSLLDGMCSALPLSDLKDGQAPPADLSG